MTGKKTPSLKKGQVLPRGFPIVGIGASAGGLEAFEQFFRHAAPDTGMAFVLVSHLDPSHASMLTEILQRSTAMPVVEAGDRMPVAPNRVYVIPPNRDLAVFHGILHLTVPEASRGQRMPIDYFLRSLAEEQGDNAIGVILSGSGTDGTLGLRAVLGSGGVAFVQDPATAKYDGMPASAVQSGLATFVLPVEKIPEALAEYSKKRRENKARSTPSTPLATGAFGKVLMLLRSRTGHDFSGYKMSTIRRRIERRMTVHGLSDTEGYVRLLQERPQEIRLLFKELLINVTSFFRDPEAFAALKEDALRRLFAGRPEGYAFRAWIPGCATGEEAYSIAVLLRELMDETGQDFKVQVYGTDIDGDSIAAARRGFYPPNIALDVSPDRLRRFFAKEEGGFRVRKPIREMIVFAVQNVIKDPPFTRLDLISCRNVLIYLEPELQSRLLRVFHYALKPGGVMFLSPSESDGAAPALFSPLGKKWKIFQPRAVLSSSRGPMMEPFPGAGKSVLAEPVEPLSKTKEPVLAELARRALLRAFAPASVITDGTGAVLYVQGDVGPFLRPAPGRATLNVADMAREGLAGELRTAFHRAAARNKPATSADIDMKGPDGRRRIRITVAPIEEPEAPAGLLLVSFERVAPPLSGLPPRGKAPTGSGPSRRVSDLERELASARETLRTTMEDTQASNEELKSANEELQSTNEELQSTNEELETSKEELQSMNEELVTLNAELQAKIEQLAGMQNDLKNLMDSTEVGAIFLDANLAIKRYTREAAAIYRLAPTDVGRPLGDIRSNIEDDDLLDDARRVLDTLASRAREVRTMSGNWFLARIMPYRTLENVIEGVVLTFSDVTALKKVEEEAQASRDLAQSIVDTIREPLLVLDSALQVVSASGSFYQAFRVSPAETLGRKLYDLGNRQWDIPELRELLESVLPEKTSFGDFEVERDFPGLGRRRILLNGRRVAGKAGAVPLIFLAFEDITGRAPRG